MYKREDDQRDYYQLYFPQKGGGDDGLVYYKTKGFRQKGYGIGGFFGSLAKKFLPFATKYLLPHAKTAMSNIVSDVMDGKRTIRETLKDNSLAALKNVGRDLLSQSGSGVRRKRVKKKTSRKKSQTGGKVKKGKRKLKTKSKVKRKTKKKVVVKRKQQRKRTDFTSLFDK